MNKEQAIREARALWPAGTIIIDESVSYGANNEVEHVHVCIACFDGLNDMPHHCMADTFEESLAKLRASVKPVAEPQAVAVEVESHAH